MRAIVLCDGHFGDTYGKTAHGLLRYGERFVVVAVVDRALAGGDAGLVLDGAANGVPIVATLEEAPPAECVVVGVATDGGRLPDEYRPLLRAAAERGLRIVAGLHERLRDDPVLARLEAEGRTVLEDVRHLPAGERFFTGAIDGVGAVRIAVVGTDSAVGKRTTARLLVRGLRAAGRTAAFIGTGQTARLEGARYGFVLDRVVNDYLTGEIEHAVVTAWEEERPEFVVLEGQGGLTHPAFPGGYELLLGARAQGAVIVHAPGRATLDGFPQYPMETPDRAAQLVELLTGAPPLGFALNHEGLDRAAVDAEAGALRARLGVAACDPLWHGVEPLVAAIQARFPPTRAVP